MTITIESPLKIRRRLRAALSPATTAKQLIQLKEKANTSLMALEYLNETPSLNLVRFYKIVSPWCDRSADLYELEKKLARIDYRQYTKAREALVSLAAQQERCEYGVNRTASGQTPTPETTFLESPWTKSVKWWEDNRDYLEKEPYTIGTTSPSIMEVVDSKASYLLKDGLDRWFKLLFDLFAS